MVRQQCTLLMDCKYFPSCRKRIPKDTKCRMLHYLKSMLHMGLCILLNISLRCSFRNHLCILNRVFMYNAYNCQHKENKFYMNSNKSNLHNSNKAMAGHSNNSYSYLDKLHNIHLWLYSHADTLYKWNCCSTLSTYLDIGRSKHWCCLWHNQVSKRYTRRG